MKIFYNLLFISAILLINPKKETKNNKKNLKIQVYLFAGQSNMDGRGNWKQISEKDQERLEKVADRIKFYYNRKAETNLQASTAPKFLKNKFKINYFFGPELFFGIEMAEKYPNQKFVFIKRSRGGTSLYGTWNPNWTAEKAKQMKEEKLPKLYFDFKDYAKSVLKKYDKNSYEIKGIMWVQGEADSNRKHYGEEPGETYAKNLQNLANTVRKDFDKPNLPFALFQVGKGKVLKGMEKVAEEDENVYLIKQSTDKNSKDYYSQYPKPMGHYTTESMKRIGVNFYKIFDNLNQ